MTTTSDERCRLERSQTVGVEELTQDAVEVLAVGLELGRERPDLVLASRLLSPQPRAKLSLEQILMESLRDPAHHSEALSTIQGGDLENSSLVPAPRPADPCRALALVLSLIHI